MEKPNKKLFWTIAMILMLALPAYLTFSPSANAFVSQWETFAYATVTPNPIGVGQTAIVTYGVDKVNPLSTIRSNLFEGFTVKITKPDGTIETKGPLTAYSMGSGYFTYTPTVTGKYTFQASFPGQWANASYTTTSTGYGNWANVTGQPLITEQRYYKPSLSPTVEITVQTDPIPTIQNNPIPTNYWTRPINGENKGWNAIADNWLMMAYDRNSAWRFASTAFAPYTTAPQSAHLLWTKPVTFGGIIGGAYGDRTYYTGLSYEPFYTPIVINGRIIYTVHGPTSTTVYGTLCLNLYTGEKIWYLNETNIAFAQILEYDSGNEHGGLAYLWDTRGSTWYMYDAFEGRQILTVANVTSGTTIFGENGELLSYSLTGTANNRRLILWNSSKAIIEDPTNRGGSLDYWSPTDMAVVDGRRGIQWNVSVPVLPGPPTIAMINEGYILAAYNDISVYPINLINVAFSANLQKDASGNYPTSISPLWNKNVTTHTQWPQYSTTIGNGIYTVWDQATTQIEAFDIKTGAALWTSNPLPMGWGMFAGGMHIAYNKVYLGSYDGHMRAYDAKTGTLVWDYYGGSAGFETAYGSWPIYGFTIAGGKIFLTTDEHSPDAVVWRGGKLTVLNAETGNPDWSIAGRIRHNTVADGINTAFNLYDNQIYTFGKGPSKTTVTSPDISVPLGTKIVIKGSVTDQTPASKDTPAISDQSMGAWMEYLYMQKPKPANATGVPVKLTAIDPNGNSVNIGTATSDANGNFAQTWAPTIEGQYKVLATFEGTYSYGSSDATTYLAVGPAPAVPQPTVAPTATPTNAPTTLPTTTASPSPVPNTGSGLGTEVYIAIAAAAVIAIVASAALILRKRK
jgi:outer membrane protein assembly factor BamB